MFALGDIESEDNVRAENNVIAGGEFVGGGADLAEYFPLAQAVEAPAPAQVVGLSAGEVSLDTDGADQVAVISSDPAFVGNPDAEEGGALVALVGQAEVMLATGTDARPGDLLIASGASDGTARAVAPEQYVPSDGPVLGRVLTVEGDRAVALVGVDEAASLRMVVQRQAEDIDALRADRDRQRGEIASLRDRLDRLESLLLSAGATDAGSQEASPSAGAER
ncbi:MAG: hypothetical protein AAGK21_11395 [Bacteroidota bacterium]